MTSAEDREPQDSVSGGCLAPSLSISGFLSPDSAALIALDGGMSALSDVEDDDDTTEGDELSDTDDEVWHAASTLQQTQI